MYKDYFPFKEFRTHQAETLDKIEEAFRTKKYVILQGSTGCGKSALALAAARSFDSAYMATANKFLQDQYMRDFSEYIVEMKGRSNYSCFINPSHSCGNAVCKIEKANCDEKHNCEYFVQLDKAKHAQTTLFNFASALAFLNHTKNFSRRDLIVIDECHALPSNLANFIEVSFSYKYLNSLKLADFIPNYPPEEYHKYIPWLKSIWEAIRGVLARMNAGDSNIEHLESLKFKIETFTERWESEPENWVIDKTLVEKWDKKKPKDLSVGDVSKIAFKPVFVHGIASQYLLPHADKFLLMSATVLSPSHLLKEIGINQEEAEFIDVPTTFPKKNRLFVFDPVGWMSYSSLDSMMPKIEQKIRKIMDMHKNERGIIHVPSYKMAEDLDKLLADTGRITFPRTATAQVLCMEEHARKEDSVLLSPSMKEGVDLKDSLSRFTIIGKVPYASLKDLVVKRKMELDGTWYAWMTMLAIIQSHGRSVRSETDYAITYMLDGNFKKLYDQTKHYLPQYFKESIVW